MNFDRIRYMEWAKRMQFIDPPGTDLSGSGMEPPSLAELGVTMRDFALSGNNVYGLPALKEAIAAKYACKPGNVLIAGGTSLSNFLMAAAILRQGDLAVVERPTYEPLARILQALGVRIAWFTRRFEDGYRIDPDRIRRKMPRCAKLIFVTNLFNPAGTLLEKGDLEAIGALARRCRAMVISDEVYLDGVFSGKTTTPAATLGDNMVTTASLGKIYGLGHLRVGWAIGPARLVRRAEHIYDHLTVHNPYIADALTLKALENLPRLRERSRRRHVENYAIVRRWIAGRPDLSWVEPAGAFMCFPRMPKGYSSRKLQTILRSKYDAQVVPGHFFGSDRHFRLGFGMKTSTLKRGLKKLGAALDDMRS
ncbi:MAG: pyridoxal phosphate-dependent aminotransferase [Planctomycetota bacterium]|nr:pyridoxal phosphate-dependent aminotransferase [Planctomycetota bacterium]